ncbi:MAG: DNA-directed RNA polymerase subunit alpha C-terminal domain-containing protein [Elusimicrobiales bacterium]
MDSEALFDKLLKPITAITLSPKAYRKLRAAGVSLIFDLVETTAERLSLIDGVDNSVIYEIEMRLDALGLSSGMDYSRTNFYKYSELKGFIFSDLFRHGHVQSTPKLIALGKAVRFDLLSVSTRAKRCVKKAGVTTVGELLVLRKSDLCRIQNCGISTCSEIGDALESLFYARLDSGNVIEIPGRKELSEEISVDIPPEKLDLKIRDLPFNRRTRNCLARGGIETVRDLLSKTHEDLLAIQGLGVGSINDINDVLGDAKRLKPTDNALIKSKRKIFANKLAIQVPDGVLSISIKELPFNSRALNAFEKRRINTVADILSRSDSQLLSIKGIGVNTLKEVIHVIKELKEPEALEIASKPIESLIEALELIKKVFESASFTADTVQDNRIRKILVTRLSPQGKTKTLKELAREFRLTRERVRQLECRGLAALEKQLGPAFWRFLRSFVNNLINSYGILFCDYPKEAFFGIEFQIYLEFARRVSRQVHFDIEDTTWLARDEEVIFSYLRKYFEKTAENGEFLYESEIRDRIANFCAKNKLSQDWGDYLFKKTHKKKLLKTKSLCSVGAPKRGAIVEMLVQKYFPNGISPTNKEDAAKFVEVFHNSEFSGTTKKPLGALRSALNNRERFILWDRGTYVVRSTISINKRVLKLAEEHIDRRLDADLVCVAVFGVFEDIKSEAILSGIPNPYALYSCLRTWTNGKYRFFKYPYIYPRHSKKRIIGATRHSIESYMRDQAGVLSTSGVAEQLGLKEYQVINAVQESDVVLRCANGKCIHINN